VSLENRLTLTFTKQALKDAEESNSTAMRSFAVGLRKDLDAVKAGLTQEWSNGCVEGFIHKLKLLKRQGYGRVGIG